MAHHDLKIWPEYYEKVKRGLKTFEVRVTDRNFKEGDTVTLREYKNENKYYTGNEITFRIGYVYLHGTQWAIFSLLPLKESTKIETPVTKKRIDYPISKLKALAEEHMEKLKEAMRKMSEEDAELASDYEFLKNEIENHELYITQINNAIETLLKN
jgi:hypothetical protein